MIRAIFLLKCSCEDGFKKLHHVCYEKNYDKLMNSVHCYNLTKPETLTNVKCDSACYNWKTSEWTSVI
jgi:hypothetical protein